MSFYCGVDLGTTNSLIGRGDTLFTGLVSSSVDVTTKHSCHRDMHGDNIVSSYKVNMTTGDTGKLSIACSSVILKDLADMASRRSGREVTDLVVSVPAKFSSSQREAVVKAVEDAGLVCRGLINEPTAAAIYTCKEVKDLVIVYDLGGGTFDVTIIDTRGGNYYVVASDGRILAGDDFDKALVERAYKACGVKMRYRNEALRKQLTHDMRKAKEEIQKNGGTSVFVSMSDYGCDCDYELTLDTYVEVMKNVFAETIRLTKYIKDENLNSVERPKIVFVGGSTACPYLRKWVCEETGLEPVHTDEQPDLIVAKGVALYAEMLEDGSAEEEVADVTKRLCIGDDCGRAVVIIEKNTTIPVEHEKMFSNSTKSSALEIPLYQGDSILAAENDYIGTLIYKYDEEVEAGQGLVLVKVHVDRDGRIKLSGEDILTGRVQQIELVMR